MSSRRLTRELKLLACVELGPGKRQQFRTEIRSSRTRGRPARNYACDQVASEESESDEPESDEIESDLCGPDESESGESEANRDVHTLTIETQTEDADTQENLDKEARLILRFFFMLKSPFAHHFTHATLLVPYLRNLDQRHTLTHTRSKHGTS